MLLLKVQKQVKVNNMLGKDTYTVAKTVKKSKGIINTIQDDHGDGGRESFVSGERHTSKASQYL